MMFIQLVTLGRLLKGNLSALFSSMHSFKTIKIQVMSIYRRAMVAMLQNIIMASRSFRSSSFIMYWCQLRRFGRIKTNGFSSFYIMEF